MKKASNKNLINIVGDGAISIPQIKDGMLLPVVVLDCSNRNDIYDVIMLHQSQPPGDVVSTWCLNILKRNCVYLNLEFLRPTPSIAFLEFDLRRHLTIVDLIFQTNALHLQPNNHGNKVSSSFLKGSICVEVFTDGAPFKWNKLAKKWARKNFKSSGLTQKESGNAANKFLIESRNFYNITKRKTKDSDI